MQLQKQPNLWSCSACAAACLLDLSYEDIIKELGHDGSAIVDDRLPEPMCRQGFHFPEIFDLCYNHNILLAELPLDAVIEVSYRGKTYPRPLNLDLVSRLEHYMPKTKGLMIGSSSARQHHMVAYANNLIFDSADGLTHQLEDPAYFFQIEQIFIASSHIASNHI